MLQQVVLQTAVPMTLDIDAVDPDEIIIIKSISGLDPADVTLFTGDFARDGGYYQGRRSSGRNPVFNLKLNPDYKNDIEVSDIRELIYDMFLEPAPDNDGLTVVLKDDRKPDRYFVGYTEKLPADIFSRDTSAQVSMICTDPFLKSVDLTTDEDAVGWVTTNIPYDGSARTGLEMRLKVTGTTSTVSVTVNGVPMTLAGSFVANDIIVINTLIGSRQITKNGADIMAALTTTSKWIQLTKGNNNVVVAGANLMEYSFRSAWWGI